MDLGKSQLPDSHSVLLSSVTACMAKSHDTLGDFSVMVIWLWPYSSPTPDPSPITCNVPSQPPDSHSVLLSSVTACCAMLGLRNTRWLSSGTFQYLHQLTVTVTVAVTVDSEEG